MSGNRLVFSTEIGRIKPPESEDNDRLLGDGQVRVRLEKKGRGGKAVTTITGLPLNETDLKALGKELKKKVGVGGAVKEGIVEIQGDQVDKMLQLLADKGFAAKRSGG